MIMGRSAGNHIVRAAAPRAHGPRPVGRPPRVLEAMARPTIGHLDPEFVRMMDELKELLRYAFQTENRVTFPVSGPGSVGMETCFVNLVEPGDKVIVCRNGVFGGAAARERRARGRRAGGRRRRLGHAGLARQGRGRARREPRRRDRLAFVHAETSTGVRSDAEAIAALAHAHGALVIVDTVTSLGGIPVLVDEWGLDAVYSGTRSA